MVDLKSVIQQKREVEKKEVMEKKFTLSWLMHIQKNSFPDLPYPRPIQTLSLHILQLCDKCISEKKELSVTGLFRRSIEAEQLKLFDQELRDKGSVDHLVELFEGDPLVPSIVLKRFFMLLDIPLFPDYSLCLQVGQSSEKDSSSSVLKLWESLPSINRRVALAISDLLKKCLEERISSASKMVRKKNSPGFNSKIFNLFFRIFKPWQLFSPLE